MENSEQQSTSALIRVRKGDYLNITLPTSTATNNEADMIRTQSLIIDKRNLAQLPKDEVKDILLNAQFARESIIDGFNAIGNLMFWACDNEKYSDSEMRGDMANIGLLLTCNAGILEGVIEAEVITDDYLDNTSFPSTK